MNDRCVTHLLAETFRIFRALELFVGMSQKDMESGALRMNLRVPLTGMVLQWTMTILVNQVAVCTTKSNRAQLLQFVFKLLVNIL